MDKLIFMFRRRSGMSRADYHHHYETSHAKLGMQLTLGIEGYTVNLVESDQTEFDAITEIWTPSASDFFDVDKVFRSPEDAQAMIDDHMSFMGPQDAYVVEEIVVRGGELDAPEATPVPWAKQISWHAATDQPDEPPAGAFRVVDHKVVRTLLIGDQPVDDAVQGWEAPPGAVGATTSDVAVIRMVWADAASLLPSPGPTRTTVRELRNRVLTP